MIDTLRLYLGLAPGDSYREQSKRWRVTLLCAQAVFVVLLVLANSWLVRAAVVAGGVMILLGIAFAEEPRPDIPQK